MDTPNKITVYYGMSKTVSTGAYESARPSISISSELSKPVSKEEIKKSLNILKELVDTAIQEKCIEIKKQINN